MPYPADNLFPSDSLYPGGSNYVRVLYDNGAYDSDIHGDLKPPVKVSMSGQFEAGAFEFSVDNSSFGYNTSFTVFKDVEVWIDDEGGPGNQLITGLLMGRKRTHDSPGVGEIKISGLDYRYPLMRIHANETYANNSAPCGATGCETSELVKDLISTYGQSLIGIASHVNSSSKYYASGAGEEYPVVDVPVWDLITKFARESGMIAYVDTDKELHFEPIGIRSTGKVLSDDPGAGEYAIKSIDAIELDAKRLHNRVIGRGSNIIRQSDNLSKQSDWGLIVEDLYKDNNIADGGVLKEVVSARVNLISLLEQEAYTLSTDSFVYASPGETIAVTDSDYGLSAEELAVQRVTWTYQEDGVINTEFVLAQYPWEYAEWFHRISSEITILKGQDSATGTTQLGKLFGELVDLSESQRIVVGTISEAFIAGDKVHGSAGLAETGISFSSISTKVDTT